MPARVSAKCRRLPQETVDASIFPTSIDREQTQRSSFPEQPRCEVLQIAAPGLPFVIGTGRFPVHVLDARLVERLVQSTQARDESFPLGRADAEPQQMNFLGELGRVGEYSV